VTASWSAGPGWWEIRALGVDGDERARALEKESQDDQQAFPGHGNRPALEQEIHRLKAENKRLLMEREILKKATALFAREGM
jgi:transposase